MIRRPSLFLFFIVAGFAGEPPEASAGLFARMNAGAQASRLGPRGNESVSNQTSHLVDAYLTLHEADASDQWLDLAAGQLDAIAAATDRWYRSCLGWSTPRYSANLIGERPDVPAAGWIVLEGAADSLVVADTIQLTGREKVPIPVAGKRLWNGAVQDNHNYEPGALYHLRCEVRAASKQEAVISLLDRRGSTTVTHRTPTSGDWSKIEFDFLAPARSGADLWLLLATAGGQSPVEFRQVEVKQYATHLIDEAMILNVLLKFVDRSRQVSSARGRHVERARGYLALVRQIVTQWDREWHRTRSFGVFRYADDGAAIQFARATVIILRLA